MSYEDRRLVHKRMLLLSIEEENKSQIAKWGIQKHTLPEWLAITTEEFGELAKAVNEYHFRGVGQMDVYHEAIQTATLVLKIAEIAEFMDKEEAEEQ